MSGRSQPKKKLLGIFGQAKGEKNILEPCPLMSVFYGGSESTGDVDTHVWMKRNKVNVSSCPCMLPTLVTYMLVHADPAVKLSSRSSLLKYTLIRLSPIDSQRPSRIRMNSAH